MRALASAGRRPRPRRGERPVALASTVAHVGIRRAHQRRCDAQHRDAAMRCGDARRRCEEAMRGGDARRLRDPRGYVRRRDQPAGAHAQAHALAMRPPLPCEGPGEPRARGRPLARPRERARVVTSATSTFAISAKPHHRGRRSRSAPVPMALGAMRAQASAGQRPPTRRGERPNAHVGVCQSGEPPTVNKIVEQAGIATVSLARQELRPRPPIPTRATEDARALRWLERACGS